MHTLRINAMLLAAALLASIGLAAGARAQNAPSGGAMNPPGTAGAMQQHPGASRAANVPTDDREFAQKAAEAGMAEVAAGRLAEKKGQDAAVKQFGQRMVQDHSQANDKLKQIASAKGLDLPTKLDKKGQKELDEFEKLSGHDFDATYVKKQVSGHKKVIKEFEKEAKSGKDADLRKFADDTLPTLRQHLDLAQSAQNEVIGKTASNAGSAKSASSGAADSGLKAARKATGLTAAHSEKQEGLPVPKTGM